MGNGFGKIGVCFTGGGDLRRTRDVAVVISDPVDELGHSFCYIGPDPSRYPSSKFYSDETATTFPTISGASVSANTSTAPLSTALVDLYRYGSIDKSSTFESSTSFASIPLQLIPQNYMNSGPLPAISGGIPGSGPMDRGFLSGPIERGFLSGPIDRGLFSGPLENDSDRLRRSYSHGGFALRRRSRKWSFVRALQRALLKKISRGQSSIVAPIRSVASAKEQDWVAGSEKQNELTIGSNSSLEDDVSTDGQNLQWAQGKAGEDRVHVVVSEDHGWVYVGIYDGFSGPDATDYLLSNLYSAVHKELQGLLWDDKKESTRTIGSCSVLSLNSTSEMELPCEFSMDDASFDWNCERKNRYRGAASKREESQRTWKCEWEQERVDLDRRLKEQPNGNGSNGCAAINHSDVLKALAEALRKTEEAYLGGADERVMEPELALMGSCVLVMLMRGEDVYVMNVGDSRAVLGQRAEPDSGFQDLERINEEPLRDLELCDEDGLNTQPSLTAVQLTMDHSTSVEEEVQRIKSEHPDDACAVKNDRVKGSLKVTRAFGAGFLKRPKWNDALLEMFRIDYIGTSPYISCLPSLHHHKLGLRDRFLILSSDGLYQYFTNEEAVSEVELFIALSPEGDPAHHLVEELLFRAAKKAGMEFHELLEIPQGDRRRYHDDVSIIVISLEGRIWKSRA